MQCSWCLSSMEKWKKFGLSRPVVENLSKLPQQVHQRIEWFLKAQDQLKYGLSTVQDCHNGLKNKLTQIKPPNRINGACNAQAQIGMWSNHLKQTLNYYLDENITRFFLKEYAICDRPEKFHLHDVIEIVQGLTQGKYIMKTTFCGNMPQHQPW